VIHAEVNKAQKTSRESVQTPNVNNLFLNDILADHERAQWSRVTRRQNSDNHKNIIKTERFPGRKGGTALIFPATI
jgi:hypothetical protein